MHASRHTPRTGRHDRERGTDESFPPVRFRLDAALVFPIGFFTDPRGARLTGLGLFGLVLTPTTLKFPVPFVFAMARIFTRRSEMARGVGAVSPSVAAEDGFL